MRYGCGWRRRCSVCVWGEGGYLWSGTVGARTRRRTEGRTSTLPATNPRCMSAPPTPLCPKEDTHARGEGGRRVLYSFRARSLLGSILITTPRERCRHTPDPSKLRVVRRSQYGLGFSSALLSLAALALARGAVAPRRTVPAWTRVYHSI